jgi:hypothetical protein
MRNVKAHRHLAKPNPQFARAGIVPVVVLISSGFAAILTPMEKG